MYFKARSILFYFELIGGVPAASVKNILPPNDILKKDTAVRKDTLNIIKPKQVSIKELKKDSVKATAKIPTALKKSVPVKNNAKIDSVVRKVIPTKYKPQKNRT